MRRERGGGGRKELSSFQRSTKKTTQRLDVFQSIPVLRIRNVPTDMVFCVIFSQRHEASGCGMQRANTLIQSSDLTEVHFGSFGFKVPHCLSTTRSNTAKS